MRRNRGGRDVDLGHRIVMGQPPLGPWPIEKRSDGLAMSFTITAKRGTAWVVAVISPEDSILTVTPGLHIARDGRPRVVSVDRKLGIMRCVLFHRMVVDAPSGVEVDHVDGDVLDLRRSKLRICSRSQNSANRRRPATANSPYRGIYQLPSGRWAAVIKLLQQSHHLGVFDTAKIAAAAYDAAASAAWPGFARLNLASASRLTSGRDAA